MMSRYFLQHKYLANEDRSPIEPCRHEVVHDIQNAPSPRVGKHTELAVHAALSAKTKA